MVTMRSITVAIAGAFNAGQTLRQDNTFTDGQCIFLHGNKIAEKRAGGLYVSLGGYPYSKTTAERLKPFCDVSKKDGKVFLNGKPWDGQWTKVPE